MFLFCVWKTFWYIKTTERKRIKSLEELKKGVESYGNCILKSVSGGYDGKQQFRFKTIADIDHNIDFTKEYILEKFLKFKQEISVAATKFKNSKISIFEPTENRHAGGILRHSKIPANISKKIFDEAQAITVKFAEKLNYIGTLNLEFMIDHEDNLYFNEYANRCHNGLWHSVNSYEICQLLWNHSPGLKRWLGRKSLLGTWNKTWLWRISQSVSQVTVL